MEAIHASASRELGVLLGSASLELSSAPPVADLAAASNPVAHRRAAPPRHGHGGARRVVCPPAAAARVRRGARRARAAQRRRGRRRRWRWRGAGGRCARGAGGAAADARGARVAASAGAVPRVGPVRRGAERRGGGAAQRRRAGVGTLREYLTVSRATCVVGTTGKGASVHITRASSQSSPVSITLRNSSPARRPEGVTAAWG